MWPQCLWEAGCAAWVGQGWPEADREDPDKAGLCVQGRAVEVCTLICRYKHDTIDDSQ